LPRPRLLPYSQVLSATPPSIAIEALVLGGPECVRVVVHSSSSRPIVTLGGRVTPSPAPPPINGLCNSRLCRPRLRPLRLRPSCLGAARRACALCVSLWGSSELGLQVCVWDTPSGGVSCLTESSRDRTFFGVLCVRHVFVCQACLVISLCGSGMSRHFPHL
jgi:hypothetical protein